MKTEKSRINRSLTANSMSTIRRKAIRNEIPPVRAAATVESIPDPESHDCLPAVLATHQAMYPRLQLAVTIKDYFRDR
jgi:hypothetical protein